MNLGQPSVFLEVAAREFAEQAHGDQRDRDQCLHTEHLERVAAMVPLADQPVAWLHDVLEDTDATIMQLKGLGLSPVQIEAVLLLTRPKGYTYREYIALIADTDGEAGEIARRVKEADLLDNTRRCLEGDDQAIDRYRLGLYDLYAAVIP
jgi:hypothetical protein